MRAAAPAAVLLLAAAPAAAEVTLPCDRPEEPTFEAPSDRAAVQRNAKALRAYSAASQAYMSCITAEVARERDRVLATVKRFRAEMRGE